MSLRLEGIEIPSEGVAEFFDEGTPVSVSLSTLSDEERIDKLASEYKTVENAINLGIFHPRRFQIKTVRGGRLEVYSADEAAARGLAATYQTEEINPISRTFLGNEGGTSFARVVYSYQISADGSIKVISGFGIPRSLAKPDNKTNDEYFFTPEFLSTLDKYLPVNVDALLRLEHGQENDSPVLEFVKVSPYILEKPTPPTRFTGEEFFNLGRKKWYF